MGKGKERSMWGFESMYSKFMFRILTKLIQGNKPKLSLITKTMAIKCTTKN